jgi:alpha-tubulin suppressor-like RCC1 family protein
VGGTLAGLATGASVVLQNNGGSNVTVSANGSFTFATAITTGGAYAVTVLTQPSTPAQTCSVTNGSGTVSANVTNVAVNCIANNPATSTVGGTLSGLAGGSVVLQNNGGSNLSVSANGAFTFATAVNTGDAYAVTVLAQPSTPAQTCTVTNGSGTASANVTNVAVNCVTDTPPLVTYTVGGTLTGLAAGASVVLQNNAGSDLTVSANGSFTFATPVNGGGAYAVTVLTQPSTPAQTCTVTNGSGTASANVTNVAIDCVTGAFGISGTVSGLLTSGSVVLQNNGADNKPISADGAFSFTAQQSGTAYAVTVLTQPTTPAAQTCTVANGTGTVGSAAVSNIAVTCVSVDQTPPTITARTPLPYTVGTKLQGAIVTVTFSEAISRNSVNPSSFSVTNSAGAVSGQFNYADNDKQITFTPGASGNGTLAFDTRYTVALTTAIRDISNNPIAAATWSFNTGKKLASGFTHNCARFTDGRVKCWGENLYGQLGYSFAPVDISPKGDNGGEMGALGFLNLGAGRTAVALAAGDNHTCAILDNGDTKCWGQNDYGELGQGNTETLGDEGGEAPFQIAPIDFGPGRKAIEIAAGQEFTCAKLDDNSVKCWGRNTYGQLGQGNTTTLGVTAGQVAAAPAIALGAGLSVEQLTLAHNHTCALLRDSAGTSHTKCWGDNHWGQLGKGDKINRGDDAGEMGDTLTDINLGAGRTAVSLAANGGHTCAILDNASVECWGLNTWGQIGRLNGNDIPPDRLVCVPGNDCVGDDAGEVGTLTAAIPGNVARLTVGYRHNCVLLINGQVKCWGSNEQAQAGIEDITGAKAIIADTPNEITALAVTALKPGTTVEELTAGGFHTCVWNTGGTLNCWGDNSSGQLGLNSVETRGDDPGEMGAGMLDTDLGI